MSGTGRPDAAVPDATGLRLGIAATKGTRERLAYTNKGKGRWAYVSVQPGAGALDATYTLAVASTATKSR